MIRVGLIVLCLATPLRADDLRPVPDYFVDTVFLTSTAQTIARACSTLSLDPAATTRLTETVLARLEADGYTSDVIATGMDDPGPAIAALQEAFLAKHDLADGAPEPQVCAAGRAEIAGDTPLGHLMLEVAE